VASSSNNRGQLGAEIFFIMIVLAIFAIGLIAVAPMVSDINQDIQDEPEMSVEAKQASQESLGNFEIIWDNNFLFLTILMWAASVVMAFFSDTHPIFMIFSILLLGFAFMTSMILSNAYQDLANSEDISDFAQEFPKMQWIMEHFLTVMIVMGTTTVLILYSKLR
jgi:hypothetical protein